MIPRQLTHKKWIDPPSGFVPDDLMHWLASFLDLEGSPTGSDFDLDVGAGDTSLGVEAGARTSLDLADGAARTGLNLVAQTLLKRGLSQEDEIQAFLDPDSYISASPYDLPGMDITVQRIQRALSQREKILVWGDFDVDGQTSTTILVSTLRQLGAQVVYHIPVRGPESHGISIQVLGQILAENQAHPVRVLLTCDTGISAQDAVEHANQQGLDVLVTDHHELPDVFPQALALVNPNFLPESHPLHTLPGVGVAYKLAEALFAACGRGEACEQFLDLAALGCVADVARLRGEARWLVQRGLKALSERKRLGLRVMMENANLQPGPVNTEHIGFSLAPRLNALGRLGDANPVVEFLSLMEDGGERRHKTGASTSAASDGGAFAAEISKVLPDNGSSIEKIGSADELRVRTFAAQLEALNSRRQLLTSQVLQAALAQIEQEPALLDEAVLVLAHPAWPGGVVGIVASRLVELFARPVILLASPPGEPARGSARSVEGVDITAALREISGGLLLGFGGHAMAAGMSLEAARIPELRKVLSQAVLRQGIPEPALAIDAFLGLEQLSLEFANQLELLAPFGAGNPDLLLATRNLLVKQTIRIGANKEHLRVILADAADREVEALWWQSADIAEQAGLEGKSIDLAYHAHPNTFRGEQRLQLTWVDYRLADQPLAALKTPQIVVEDHRRSPHPLPVLEKMLAAQPQLAVFAEGEAVEMLRQRLPGLRIVDRTNSEPLAALAIWTPPPSRAELRRLLISCQPASLALFAVPPQTEKLTPFLQRLTGLVKYALRARSGQLDLAQLAAAAAQGEFTVRLGLDWLAAKGYIMILEDQGNALRLGEARSVDNDALHETDRKNRQADAQEKLQLAAQIAAQITVLLDEAAAFRDYYQRAEVKALSDR